MTVGVLVERSRSRTQTCSSASETVAGRGAAPPRRPPPRPTRRRGCRSPRPRPRPGAPCSTSSISPGEMFSPPRTITSSSRPSTYKKPSRVEPAGVAGAEPPVLGRARMRPTYSPATCSPRTQISPFSPAGEDRLVLAAHLHLERSAADARPSRAGPAPPGRREAKASRWSSGVSMAMVERGLGQPVGVDQVDVGQVAQRPLDQLERHAPAAVGEVAQRRRLDAAPPRPRRGSARAWSAPPWRG